MRHDTNDVTCVVHGSKFLFKPDTYIIKVLKPCFAPDVLDIIEERFPRFQKRVLVALVVHAVPLTLTQSIEVNIFFSEINCSR